MTNPRYSSDIGEICEQVRKGLIGRLSYGILTSLAFGFMVSWSIGVALLFGWAVASVWESRAFPAFARNPSDKSAEANMLLSMFANMSTTSSAIFIAAIQMDVALSILAGVYASTTLISLIIVFVKERFLLSIALIPMIASISATSVFLAFQFSAAGNLSTALAMIVLPIAFGIMGYVPYAALREFDRRSQTALELARTRKALAEHHLEDAKQQRREAQAARKAAEAANIAKSDFLASMSHEIRTPMNGVVGMAEMLMNSGLSDQQKRYARIIQVSGEGLLVIINDILDFAKLEAREIDLHPVWFSLSELAESVMAIIATKSESSTVSFDTWIDPSLPDRFYGDELRIRQVLLNLAGNAAKFTDEGFVRLTIQRNPVASDDAQTTLTFSLQDTGIGIDPERIDHMFDKFSQADTSTTRTYGGTGLGLAICRELVELLSGTIWATSEPGKGSVFSFYIPLIADGNEIIHELEGELIRPKRLSA